MIILDDLSKVASAVRIGQRTVQVALQSIWIGIALSVALMIAAAAGFVPAIAGALSQELVDLATILNALRALSAGKQGAGKQGAAKSAAGPTGAGAGTRGQKDAGVSTGKPPASRLPRSAGRS